MHGGQIKREEESIEENVAKEYRRRNKNENFIEVVD